MTEDDGNKRHKADGSAAGDRKGQPVAFLVAALVRVHPDRPPGRRPAPVLGPGPAVALGKQAVTWVAWADSLPPMVTVALEAALATLAVLVARARSPAA